MKGPNNESTHSSPERVKLGHGSLRVMEAGMQDIHVHRIPKADRVVGPRISLTFRGYVTPLCDSIQEKIR